MERRAVRQYDVADRAVALESRYLGLGGFPFE